MTVPQLDQLKVVLFSYSSMALSAGLPIVIFGALSGTIGWTPGKLLLFLRVKDRNGRSPGVTQGILREIVKYVGTSFMFLGSLWALYGVVTSQTTIYDDWLGLDVDDLKPTGCTKIEKN